jgi:hypothetical protein
LALRARLQPVTRRRITAVDAYQLARFASELRELERLERSGVSRKVAVLRVFAPVPSCHLCRRVLVAATVNGAEIGRLFCPHCGDV